MSEATRPIAIIPSESFRWQPRVQFIDSFRTREAALNCAFEHDYNLIVEHNEAKSVLFDVMDDPEGACTSGLELELLKTEEVIVDPYSEGWTSLMILSMWELARRIGIAVARLCARQVVPLLHQAASRRNRKAFEHAVRHAWRRITRAPREGIHTPTWPSPIPASCKVKTFSLSTARIYTKRIALRGDAFYHREIVPVLRSAAHRCWWSDFAIAVRRSWYRHSRGSISDVARCFAAEASILYTRKVIPFCRSAASRSWWSGPAIALRRGWYRYSKGSILDAARRLNAEASVLYARQLTPRFRDAIVYCRQGDIPGVCRRALSVTVLTAIHITDRLAAAVAHFYVQQVAPRLQQAALHYQQADIEGALRRSVVVVAPPRQSNASQVH